MIPVRTRASNFVFRGPSPEVGDAWVDRQIARAEVWMVWKPDPTELAAIAAGGLIRLGLFTNSTIPPVSIDVTDQIELSPAGAALRDGAIQILKGLGAPGPTSAPAGHWFVSEAVWTALQTERALDDHDGVPTLYGRPLIAGDVDGVSMQFVPLRGDQS